MAKDTEFLQFHAVLEAEVMRLKYGQITFNVMIKNGIPLMDTINIVKQRRYKYPPVKRNLTTEG